MADKENVSILIDPSDDDPALQEQLLEKQKKLIKETNPELHSVFEKYKNFHKTEED